MDLETALFCFAVFIVLAVVVYFISVLGVAGKTFEEAMEEQRQQQAKEILQQQTKSEKPKKDKKYKKLTKRTKEKVTPEEEFHSIVNDPHVDFKIEAEIIPQELEPEVKPVKAKKKPKPPKSILINKQEGGLSVAVPEAMVSSDDSDTTPPISKVPKDEVQRKLSLTSIGSQCNDSGDTETRGQVEEKKREHSKSPEKVKYQKEEINMVANATKKAKKTKQDSVELVDGEISAKKLFAMVRNATLVGDEIQMLIEVLLNKQQGEAAEWTKKNDPVAALKKQLQEKEQQLEEERHLAQTTATKTKELRLELNQEKVRCNTNERNSREKIAQLQQEIANLQANGQRSRTTLDQRVAELQSVRQQMQQYKTEINDLEQQHKNDINELEQQISQLEAEKQGWLGMEVQMQRELEQLRSTQVGRVALEQELESLKQQVARLEAQGAELRDLEQRNASTIQELQRTKNTCNTLEGEKNAFQKRLEAQELQHRKVNDEVHNLKTVLRESQSKQQESEMQIEQQLNLIKNLENKNNDYVQQVKELKAEIDRLSSELLAVSVRTAAEGQESPVHQQNGDMLRDEQQRIENIEQSKIIEEKEKLMVQLKDEINSNKLHIVTLTGELETQKEKNNELREKNWKAMEALSTAEAAKLKLMKELDERLQDEANLKVISDLEHRLKEVSRKSEEKVQQFKKANEELVQRIEEQQLLEREILQRLLPELELDHKLDQRRWIESYEKCADQLLKTLRTSAFDPNGEQDVKLEAQVHHYKNVLSDTENMLKKLQSGVEAAELDWKEKLGAKEQELHKVLAEKKVLEESLKERQSLDVATSEVRELQAKLQELQSKLQGEEHEKKLLEQKFEEVNKNAQDLQDQIEGRKHELEELRSEKVNYEKSVKDFEKVQSELEKERKINKDLSAHTVKLGSLVKIGQASLQAEQDLVKSLQAQIEASTVTSTNGTPVTPAKVAPEIDSVSAPVKTDKPNKHKKRGALGKK